MLRAMLQLAWSERCHTFALQEAGRCLRVTRIFSETLTLLNRPYLCDMVSLGEPRASQPCDIVAPLARSYIVTVHYVSRLPAPV